MMVMGLSYTVRSFSVLIISPCVIISDIPTSDKPIIINMVLKLTFDSRFLINSIVSFLASKNTAINISDMMDLIIIIYPPVVKY